MISVIIPTLNEKSVIDSTLRHLQSLGGNFEVIVVDGGSRDGTTEVAGGYFTVVSSPPGRAVQMNSGAKLARGETLLFLHADTLLPSGAFSFIAEALSDPDIIGGRFRIRLDNRRPIFRLISWGINLRDRLIGGFTGDQTIFVRRKIFEEMGGYRELPLMEDLDLALRLQRSGKLARIQDPVVTSARRWEKHGPLRTTLLMWALRWLFMLGVPPPILKKLWR
ncbi:MAG: TIGR04283 family arsenosugar biosynthesis glycosyltransferase [Candidatus Binatia bacterium]